jgi:hypothetical protein
MPPAKAAHVKTKAEPAKGNTAKKSTTKYALFAGLGARSRAGCGCVEPRWRTRRAGSRRAERIAVPLFQEWMAKNG